jgi:hypothetical protein
MKPIDKAKLEMGEREAYSWAPSVFLYQFAYLFCETKNYNEMFRVVLDKQF